MLNLLLKNFFWSTHKILSSGKSCLGLKNFVEKDVWFSRESQNQISVFHEVHDIFSEKKNIGEEKVRKSLSKKKCGVVCIFMMDKVKKIFFNIFEDHFQEKSSFIQKEFCLLVDSKPRFSHQMDPSIARLTDGQSPRL